MDILIVDDEPVSLAVMKQLIARLPGCNTNAFSQPSSALSWCEANEPDLLIVDYVMPEIDGVEFTRRVRHIPGREHTPVVIVTVKGERDILRRALETGVNDFLRKPFDVVDLQSCVSNMLGLRAIHKQLANRALLLDARGRSAAKQGKELGLLDIEVTRARLGGDETLWQEVVRLFNNTVPQVMSTLRAALTDRDLERVLAQVSSLTGAVGVLEAPDVTEFLEKVELHATNGDLASTVASFAMAQTLVERLLRELCASTFSRPVLKTGT